MRMIRDLTGRHRRLHRDPHGGYDYFARTDDFPRSWRWGEVPPELATSPPEGLAFSGDGVTYRWRRWSVSGNRRQNTRPLVALQVQSDDRDLLRVWQGAEWMSNNRRATLVIE